MTHKLIALLLLCTALAAHGQKPAQKPAQKPTQSPARRAPPPPTVVLPPAAGEQLAAAALAYYGGYTCETNQTLQLSLNPRNEGYIDMFFSKQLHTMKPVLSSTGVLRLEDVSGRLLLLQVALKSMLLDVQSGRRLADDCVHERQAENRRTAAATPAEPGLGVDPVRAAAAAAAPASAPAAAAQGEAVPSGASGGPASAEPPAAPASAASSATAESPPAAGAKP